MKKLILLCVPLLLCADNFQELVNLANNSLQVKQQQEQIRIQQTNVSSSKAANYGSLNLQYSATHLQQNPTIKINIGGIKQKIQSGMRNNYSGAIVYSYPLFHGFAINATIEQSKLQLIKEKLSLKNIKRVLVLKMARLYASIYAQQKLISALQFSKQAVLSAKNQIDMSYKQGLTDRHEVDNMNAKYYAVIADIHQAKSTRDELLATLSYIVNQNVSKIGSLPPVKLLDFNHPSIASRADVLAIQKELNMADEGIKLAKSRFYPTVNLQVAAKRVANLAMLNKNYYQNKNQSFIGIDIKYNLFSGGADKAQLQASQLRKLKTDTFYHDYLNNATTTYNNDLKQFNTLRFELTAAVQEETASASYYSYMAARLQQGLINSVDLNYAISQLATSKAKIAQIQANLFDTYEMLILDGNLTQQSGAKIINFTSNTISSDTQTKPIVFVQHVNTSVVKKLPLHVKIDTLKCSVTAWRVFVRSKPLEGKIQNVWRDGHPFIATIKLKLQNGSSWFKISQDCYHNHCTLLQKPLWISTNYAICKN